MLSRLSLTGVSSVPMTAEALAGLALLAALPCVSAQPGEREIGPASGFFEWVVYFCVGVFLVWIGTRLVGRLLASPPGESGERDKKWPENPGVKIAEPSGEEDKDGAESSDFSPEEWAEAEAKLAEAERRTGLAFVQRAKLRRQLAAGGIVDVPVFQQRKGPLPEWLTGGSASGNSAMAVPTAMGASLGSLFATCGGTLLIMVGSPRPEWGRLRSCCRALSQSVVLMLASQIRNTRNLVLQDETGSGAASSSDVPRHSTAAQSSGLEAHEILQSNQNRRAGYFITRIRDVTFVAEPWEF